MADFFKDLIILKTYKGYPLYVHESDFRWLETPDGVKYRIVQYEGVWYRESGIDAGGSIWAEIREENQ